MSKLPISVCIIAKDEEKHIENCLKRLLPYGFEVIVTDTGSTDATKEIAMKYGENKIGITYKIRTSKDDVILKLEPLVNYRNFHQTKNIFSQTFWKDFS